MINTDNQKWNELIVKVHENKQEHILRFWDELSSPQKENLIDQISDIDFELLKKLTADALNPKKSGGDDHKLEPADFITLSERQSLDSEAKKIGEQLLRSGKVAEFLVAGGQGTRLGFDGPKGMYPVTPVKKKSLFQLHAEKLLAVGKRYGVKVPWYIMTSLTNNDQTVQFFKENQYFGYTAEDIFFLIQETSV